MKDHVHTRDGHRALARYNTPLLPSGDGRFPFSNVSLVGIGEGGRRWLKHHHIYPRTCLTRRSLERCRGSPKYARRSRAISQEPVGGVRGQFVSFELLRSLRFPILVLHRSSLVGVANRPRFGTEAGPTLRAGLDLTIPRGRCQRHRPSPVDPLPAGIH